MQGEGKASFCLCVLLSARLTLTTTIIGGAGEAIGSYVIGQMTRFSTWGECD